MPTRIYYGYCLAVKYKNVTINTLCINCNNYLEAKELGMRKCLSIFPIDLLWDRHDVVLHEVNREMITRVADEYKREKG